MVDSEAHPELEFHSAIEGTEGNQCFQIYTSLNFILFFKSLSFSEFLLYFGVCACMLITLVMSSSLRPHGL